jgi:hypothetical protein
MMSRFSYKSVPFFGTKAPGRDSRAHKENGTNVPSRFPSRFVPSVSRFVSLQQECSHGA